MDPTVYAIPAFFGTMGLEHVLLRRRAEQQGRPAGEAPGDYEWRDTVTSLTMGVGSLLAPLVVPKVLGPITPGKGRYGKALIGVAAAAIATTVIADRLAGSDPPDAGEPATDPAATPTPPRRDRRHIARHVAGIGAAASVVAGGVAITSTLASRTSMDRASRHRLMPDLGTGLAALAAATLGWDFIYYWNHRFMHTSRYMWAIHVVHHSSERYNLSTALRQPVADGLGTFVPYSALALLGIRPELIVQARAINLLYQYWIHTDLIDRIGPLEEVLNTPSHHRVHHGVNPQYLDRNHGSILIIWDRLFGTFEREREPVVYGLTKNIKTFNPIRVATHEHVAMVRDVSRSRTWRERFSFVLRGPGWAYRRHAEQVRTDPAVVEPAAA
jgi:sterol desaturase/sphingolipid hydroxylase (fatty acid hydroxylase superfamily)